MSTIHKTNQPTHEREVHESIIDRDTLGSDRPNRATRRAGGERPERRQRGRQLIAAAVLSSTALSLAPATPMPILGDTVSVAEAATLNFPTANGWANPVAGTSRFEDWGFGGSYCYLAGLEHLGTDSQGASAGARVSAVADGTVRQLVSWGTWGAAIAIEHKTSDGKRFLAIYGHVNSEVRAGATVTKGQPIGSLFNLGDNSHLHIGINPIGSGENPTTMPVRGSTTCGTSDLGYVNPIPFLNQNRPASSSTSTPASSYVGKIVRNRETGAAYLVKSDGRRYHIPSGGDYQGMVNNGIPIVNLSPSQINAIAEASAKASVKRRDEPSISGPSRWMIRRTGTSHGFGRDYWITQSAAGKSYTTNSATWTISGEPHGVYRVKVFVPKREAVAQVSYRIYDGTKHIKTVTINQRNLYGWTTLADVNIASGTIRIVQADNWGPGPYGTNIGWDAVEAIPLR